MTSLVFFGSSTYSLIVLKKLLLSPLFKVLLIVTKTDKPFGRNQSVTPNPVAQFALDSHLPLLQLESFSPDLRSKINDLSPDLGLCVAFGPPFFDEKMLNLFPQGIVNIHPSPLPKYRGATPGPWQIINGETTSAVTFFQLDLQPDHGPLIAQIPFTILPTDTSDSFYQKAFDVAANHLYSLLLPTRTVQDETQKSYYPKLTKVLAKIDWSWDEVKIERFIRAMNPWPIAWTDILDKSNNLFKMKVISAKIINGNLELQNVHIEGKKPTLWSEISSHYSLKK